MVPGVTRGVVLKPPKGDAPASAVSDAAAATLALSVAVPLLTCRDADGDAVFGRLHLAGELALPATGGIDAGDVTNGSLLCRGAQSRSRTAAPGVRSLEASAATAAMSESETGSRWLAILLAGASSREPDVVGLLVLGL